MSANYPLPSKAALLNQYVGKNLADIPLPAAVLDLAVIKAHCAQTLEFVASLGFELRVQTLEITELQLGENPAEVRLLVSTLSEAENLLPLILKYQMNGKDVDVLYGVPISSSQVERAAAFSKTIGKHGGTMRFLIDHSFQIRLLQRIYELSGYPPHFYIALSNLPSQFGLLPQSEEFRALFGQVERIIHRDGPTSMVFVGIYSNVPDSTRFNSSLFGFHTFDNQLQTMLDAAPIEGIRLSVGVLPTVPKFLTSLFPPRDMRIKVEDFKVGALQDIRRSHHQVEIYCVGIPLVPGVYTHTDGLESPLTIMTEIISGQATHGPLAKTGYVVAAGSSSLGTVRPIGEGFHSVTVKKWLHSNRRYAQDVSEEWQIQKLERYYSLLTRSIGANEADEPPFTTGDRIRLFPDDPEDASEGFGWYFVVDSSRVGREDEIVDIFVRWRGF